MYNLLHVRSSIHRPLHDLKEVQPSYQKINQPINQGCDSDFDE